nr:ras-associated and pleckstrin homology domains-containing protein 1-like [Labrus bergylta]
MELSTSEGQLGISIDANTVRLPPTTLQDFDLPLLVLRRFCSDPDSVLNPTSTGGAIWCHVLPSMKKGQIITISRQLPKDGPFRTYSDLQSHWNHLYGYRLPELADEEMVYCSIYFRLVGERLFTYPLSCIRLQPVQPCPRVSLQGALGSFLSDVSERLQSVCGFPARLTNKPCYRTVGLCTAATVKVLNGEQVNLTSSCSIRPVLTQLPPPPPLPPRPLKRSFSSQPPGRVPLTQQDGVQRILGNGCGFRETGRLTQSQGYQEDQHWPSSSSCGVSSSSDSSRHQSAPSLSSSASFSQFSSQPPPSPPPPSPRPPLCSPSSSPTQTPVLPPPKLVPIFKNKCPSRRINVALLRAQKQGQQLIGGGEERGRVTLPAFGKKTPTTFCTSSSSSSSSSVFSLSASSCPPTIPSFKPRPKPKSSAFPLPAGYPKLKRLPSLSPASRSKPALILSPNPEIQYEAKSSNITEKMASLESNTAAMSRGKVQEQASKQPSAAPPEPPRLLTAAEISNSSTTGVVFESKPKKSKSLLRVTDVEKMARSNQLFKLNSATLLAWLKVRGATVSAKHKKEELMLKVMGCLAEA